MKRLAIVIILILLLFVSGCQSDPLTETIYIAKDNGTTYALDGEFIPPAIYARWSVTTNSNVGTTMALDGVTGDYFTLAPNSVVAFKLIIVARDNVADEIGVWKVENGSIKRAGANTAVLITATTDIVVREDATWSVTITGAPAHDALNIVVIGDAVNQTKWSAVLYGVEVHF